MTLGTELLRHKNGFVRKGTTAALRIPRFLHRNLESTDVGTPVLVNSFPKSGTHLLDQILLAVDDRKDYGTFISSMTSSFTFKKLSQRQTNRTIDKIAPRELLRAHLFYSPETSQRLSQKRVAHFFIYRDLRDVVVSDAHYLRNINRWHKLHQVFKSCNDMREAILLAIRGLDHNSNTGLDYPNIGERFSRYMGWLSDDRACCVRFEDLISDRKVQHIRAIAQQFASVSGESIDIENMTKRALDRVQPKKSHTFRSGKSGGWSDAFDDAMKAEFKEVAGELLIKLGYETGKDW